MFKRYFERKDRFTRIVKVPPPSIEEEGGLDDDPLFDFANYRDYGKADAMTTRTT